jgi:hypothetical protein
MTVCARADAETASMKICIVSDGHDRAAILRTAVAATTVQGTNAAIRGILADLDTRAFDVRRVETTREAGLPARAHEELR